MEQYEGKRISPWHDIPLFAKVCVCVCVCVCVYAYACVCPSLPRSLTHDISLSAKGSTPEDKLFHFICEIPKGCVSVCLSVFLSLSVSLSLCLPLPLSVSLPVSKGFVSQLLSSSAHCLVHC